jgi:hypothetical protein
MIRLVNKRKLVALAVLSLMFAGCFSYTRKVTEPAPAVAVQPVPAPSETTTTTTSSDDGTVQKNSTTTYSNP